MATAVMVVLTGCSGSNPSNVSKVTYNSSGECWYCEDTPTHGYKVSGGTSYVCKEDSTICMFCDEKVTKQFENAIGEMTFVCDDCYQDAMDITEW